MDKHESHFLHGSDFFFELEQFIAFARILARDVLPVPLVPENIKA